MASNEPKYKPRRIRGTPAYALRNYIAFGGVVFSVVVGLIFDSLPANKRLKERIKSGEFDATPEELERKGLIYNPDLRGLPPHSRETILKKLQESDDLATRAVFMEDK